jgi:hypothetical protein
METSREWATPGCAGDSAGSHLPPPNASALPLVLPANSDISPRPAMLATLSAAYSARRGQRNAPATAQPLTASAGGNAAWEGLVDSGAGRKRARIVTT